MAQGQKRRGPFLTIWLTLMLFFNLLGLFNFYILFGGLGPIVHPVWAYLLSGAMSLALLVLVVFLFLWKRWAFWGICGVAVIGIVMNLTIGNWSGIVGAIGGPAILYLAMKSKWALFQ